MRTEGFRGAKPFLCSLRNTVSKRLWMRRHLVGVVLILGLFGLVGLLVAGVTASPDPGGIVAHWRFDEGSGSVAHDWTANNNHGTIYGATWVYGGPHTIPSMEKALSFDGVDDYVEVPHSTSLDITSAITIDAWIKPNSDTGAIVGKNGAYAFSLKNNELRFTLPGVWDADSSGANLQIGNWYHVAVVYDRQNVKFYKDGVYFFSVAHTDPIPSSTGILQIGNNQWNAYFNGLIDDVRIFDHANAPPTASRYSPASDSITLTVGQSQTFVVLGQDPDGNLWGTEWYMSGHQVSHWTLSGSSGTDSWSHTFDNVGTFHVEALVFDTMEGYSSGHEALWTVTVSALGLAETPWPKFQHDARNTGRSPYVGAQENTLKWSFDAGHRFRGGVVIGGDGTIYTHNYAFYPNGSIKWTFSPAPDVSTWAIGNDGTLYCGTWDGYIHAVNLDGTEKWSFKTGGAGLEGGVWASAAIGADGTIYVGAYDNNFYAINPDGTLKWSYKTGAAISSSAAIGDDNTIYFGSEDSSFYALNPDGTLKWSFQTESGIGSSPAIGAGGTIYFGNWDYLYALNPDGTEKWSKEIRSVRAGMSRLSSPAVGVDGTIYVGTYHGLYALNPDSTQKWYFPLEWGNIGAPAIGGDGTIYFGGWRDSNFYALNPDGTLKWFFKTGGRVESPPAIGADGTIYFGSWDNNLYAIGPSAPLIIPATIDIDPDTLNLKSSGRWITAYIELPSGYSVENIDVSTVRLLVDNDNVPAEPKPTGIGDHDNNGIADLMVKFSRSAVQALAEIGEVEMTVIGEVAGVPFEGSDIIRVIDFGTDTLYQARLGVSLNLDNGQGLAVRFYAYSGAFQGENVLWGGAAPARVVFLGNVPHPANKPVEEDTLVLTDNEGNVISTIASFVVGRGMLETRYMEIPMDWSLAPPKERVELEIEYMEIPLQWALAPS